MATRPARPCKHRGCPTLCRNGATWCERHAHEAPAVGWAATQARKGNRHERGYGADWDRLRLFILRRDGGICRCADCARTGRVLVAHEVDHIVSKARGGTDDPSNLQAINRDCHKRKTQLER